MGDCGNVVFPSEAGNLFLYTHMRGTDLPLIVKRALALQARWDDPPYLARIVFEHMIEVREAGAYRWLGFGISLEISDNNWPLLVLDCASRKVRFCSVGQYGANAVGPERWKSDFADYVGSCDEALSLAWSEAVSHCRLWRRVPAEEMSKAIPTRPSGRWVK
jgi:hypothetical protein